MERKFKLAIEEYQCCGKHRSGTMVSNVGSIFLGLPTGFNRLGMNKEMKPYIFDTIENSDWEYDMWNVPVWKYLSKDNHTFVRGIMPRRNEPFIHVYLENCIDKINCLEISQDVVDSMD